MAQSSKALSSRARHVSQAIPAPQPTAYTRPGWHHQSVGCTAVHSWNPAAAKAPAAAAAFAGGPAARSIAAKAAAGAQQPFPVGSTAAWWPAGNAVYQLYDAINKRNVSQLAACFAAGVQYQNLALMETFTGASAVTGFYQDSLLALPAGAEIVLEQHAGSQQQPGSAGSSTMAVVWRLMLPESRATVSRGVAFFCLDSSGHITRILDSPEHPVKLSARGLTVFGPLVQGLAAPMLPVVQDLGRVMQQGVDMLLQPLEALVSQQDGGAASGSNSWPAGGSSSSNGSSAQPQVSSFSNMGPGSTSSPQYPAAAAAGPASGAPAAPAAVTTATAAGAAQQAQAVGRATAANRRVVAAATAAGPLGGDGPADQQQQQQQSPNFSGLWVKVPERSDIAGYEAALDVLGLSGLQKVTARLIDGIEIQQSSTRFIVNFVTVVPFFRVTEDVPLDGGSTQLGRRDLRFGRQKTEARSVPGGVLVEMSWGAPLAGTLTERYTLMEDGCMCVEADTRVGDKAANSKTVYQRTSSSRDEVLSQSKQRNPSVGAVLQKQRQEGLDV